MIGTPRDATPSFYETMMICPAACRRDECHPRQGVIIRLEVTLILGGYGYAYSLHSIKAVSKMSRPRGRGGSLAGRRTDVHVSVDLLALTLILIPSRRSHFKEYSFLVTGTIDLLRYINQD